MPIDLNIQYLTNPNSPMALIKTIFRTSEFVLISVKPICWSTSALLLLGCFTTCGVHTTSLRGYCLLKLGTSCLEIESEFGYFRVRSLFQV